MYLEYFGLNEEPFSLTPDPRFMFLSRQHEAAAESLFYGICQRKGFLLLTGEIGTGKTTVSRQLMNRLNDNTAVSVILNPLISIPGLLKAINRDFGNSSVEGGAGEQLSALYNFLLSRAQLGQNAMVLIDEAQNLSTQALEMIRLLSNLETDRHKLLQIVLVGQPELEKKLHSYCLRQLNQRISVRQRLGKLSFEELKAYIFHRLLVAGSHGDLSFTRKSFKTIYQYTNGFPRISNNLCDRVLLAAYAKRTKIVDRRLVQEGIADLNGRSNRSRWRFWACP